MTKSIEIIRSYLHNTLYKNHILVVYQLYHLREWVKIYYIYAHILPIRISRITNILKIMMFFVENKTAIIIF